MSGNKCGGCGKTVYPMERIELGSVYHKACARCVVCKATLTVKSYKRYENAIYCAKDYPPSQTVDRRGDEEAAPVEHNHGAHEESHHHEEHHEENTHEHHHEQEEEAYDQEE